MAQLETGVLSGNSGLVRHASEAHTSQALQLDHRSQGGVSRGNIEKHVGHGPLPQCVPRDLSESEDISRDTRRQAGSLLTPLTVRRIITRREIPSENRELRI